MLKDRFDMPLKIKAVDKSGEFSGYGSVFGVEDSYGDVVVPGAFEGSLKNKMPAMLWQHDTSEPIGIFTYLNSGVDFSFSRNSASPSASR